MPQLDTNQTHDEDEDDQVTESQNTDAQNVDDDTNDEADKTNQTPAEDETLALKEQLRAADRARVEAQNKLKEFERAKLDETERTKAELEDARAEIEQLKSANEQRAVENAFLTNNKYDFHNPATALRLLNREGLTVNEDGTVTGMDEAISALAKSDPYLIKAKEQKQQEKKGSTAPQGGKRSDQNSDRAKLEKKYPALRR